MLPNGCVREAFPKGDFGAGVGVDSAWEQKKLEATLARNACKSRKPRSGSPQRPAARPVLRSSNEVHAFLPFLHLFMLRRSYLITGALQLIFIKDCNHDYRHLTFLRTNLFPNECRQLVDMDTP